MVSTLQGSVRPAVHVARGASYLIARSLLTAIISLAAFAVIARSISRADMGGLAVLNLVSAGATILAGLGVGATATRFVASLQAKGDYDGMRKAGYECLLINATAALIMAAAAYLFANSLSQFLLGTPTRGNLFRLLAWEILALGVYYSLSNLAVGLRRFRELSIIAVCSFTVRQGLVVLFLILGFGLPGIVLGWSIGDSLNSALLLSVIKKALGPFKVGFGAGRLLKFSAPLYFGEAASYAWTWFDRALLLPLVSLSQLGAYNVAVTAYGIVDSLPSGVSSALFPTYSGIYKEGEASGTADLEGAIKTASRYLSFFTIPLAVGLAVTAFPAATLLAGSSYADSALPLAILSIFLATACLLRSLGGMFVVLGKSVTSALVTVASIIIPILLGAAIIPQIGIIGGAIARGSALIIALVIMTVILRRTLKLRFDLSAYARAWAAAIVMAVVVAALELLFYSKFLLPLYLVVGGLVFLLSIRLLHAVKAEDVDLLSSFLTKRTEFLAHLLGRAVGVKPSNLD